eukprot:s467_g1.t1
MRLRTTGAPRQELGLPRMFPCAILTSGKAVDRKLLAYPELRYARLCKLVVFEVELGGRFNFSFLRLRARQRAPWRRAGGEDAFDAVAGQKGIKLILAEGLGWQPGRSNCRARFAGCIAAMHATPIAAVAQSKDWSHISFNWPEKL